MRPVTGTKMWKVFEWLFVGFFLCATGFCCPIELSSSTVVVRYGDSVSVNCSRLGNWDDSIGWEASQGGTGGQSVRHLLWSVDKLTEWDIEPKCYISPGQNSSTTQCHVKLEVHVISFPDTINIRCPSHPDMVVTEGQKVDLSCDVHNVAPANYLSVVWYKRNVPSKLEDFHSQIKQPLNQSSCYSFKATRDDDGVKIRCKAMLKLKIEGYNINVSSQEFTLKVKYPPTPILELEDAEVEVGSQVQLKCSTIGKPQPKYSWTYNQRANVGGFIVNDISYLSINNATAHNMGLYTCHAVNEIGNVSKTATVTIKDPMQECPIEITPQRMVIQYQGERQNATCKPMPLSSINVKEVYWQDRHFYDKSIKTWSADTSEDWDAAPHCTAMLRNLQSCSKPLNFTLYKMPDSVSIRGGLNFSWVENKRIQLHCDIVNVAPARNLAVQWFQGNQTIEPSSQEPQRLYVSLPENCKDCDNSTINTPVNVSSTISFTVNRTHSKAEFKCEAQLDLGIQPPPSMMSSSFNFTVYYKPIINTTKLPKKIPVFRGYPSNLVCEAEGNPPPEIQWLFHTKEILHVSGNITVNEEGVYRCRATNAVDSVDHEIEAILNEDYLPLIAGFVAVTVVIISIIFIFIYSIYYKNTKMRRYSLKNPKLSNHNGNVAHNGWDMQFPMTKLS